MGEIGPMRLVQSAAGFSYTIFHPLYSWCTRPPPHPPPTPATWWWRVGGSQREACTARHPIPPMEFEPSHPRRLAPVAVVGEGGMLRPRLRFGITSTSSTSRLITLSAAAVAAAAVATVAAVGCGEAVVEVAYEEEEGEAKVAATKEEKK